MSSIFKINLLAQNALFLKECLKKRNTSSLLDFITLFSQKKEQMILLNNVSLRCTYFLILPTVS